MCENTSLLQDNNCKMKRFLNPSIPLVKAIPLDVLEKADKLLFVFHAAIGDFFYLQNCFRAIKQAYPHLRIDFFMDELRKTEDQSKWPSLANYLINDWLEQSPYISKVYRKTYSPQFFKASVAEVQQENYPIVLSLCSLNRDYYARLIRKMSPHGYTIGQYKNTFFLDFNKYFAYKALDHRIPRYKFRQHSQIEHISKIYADWFEQLFSIEISESDRASFMDIPDQWMLYAKKQFEQWSITSQDQVIFLNSYSKAPERCWPVERMIQLAEFMRHEIKWQHAKFILNVLPEEVHHVTQLLKQHNAVNVFIFSAQDNFYQLPAILSLSHLVISVETAVMHLATAFKLPILALMRQSSPEWIPQDTNRAHILWTHQPKDHVSDLTIENVISFLKDKF